MFALFLFISIIITYIDVKNNLIPDKIVLPAILGLLVLKFLDESLSTNDFFAAAIVFTVFVVPVAFNMLFGGGDIRFGVFCALFVGLGDIGWFIMLSGLIHLLILYILREKSFAFAPSMSLSALMTYSAGVL